jgi:drug/metabolite transporter (DMT)-like permease
VFAALLCTFLFSVSVVCAHQSARLLGGTEANFWRLSVATLLLGIWAFGFGHGLDGEAFPTFFASGIVGIGLGDMALFQALPLLGSRLSLLLINCLTAPFAALLEWLWLGTSLSAIQILCGLVILAGIAWALLPSEHVHRSRRDMFSGAGFCIFSALAGAAGAVLSRKAYGLVHAAGQRIDGGNAAFQRVVGGLLIAGLVLLLVKRRALKQTNRPGGPSAQLVSSKCRVIWPWVLLNGLAGQTLGVSFMQRALETTPTGIVLAIIATTPLVVVPLAMAFEHERPTLHSLIGGIIAVGGVIGLIVSR